MRTPSRYVEAPPITPAPFGLLSVATVLEDQDPKVAFGSQYQPYACGPAAATEGPCSPDYLGNLTVTVDDAGVATLTTDADQAATSILVDWGDGSAVEEATLPGDVTHTYADPGTYTVTVSDNRGGTSGTWDGTAEVTVTAATDTGPFFVTGDRQWDSEDGIGLVQSHPFTVYRLATCRLVGETQAAAEDRATRELHLGEARAVESIVALDLAAQAGSDDGGGLIEADAQHPVLALAALEDYARANYGGVAVIHMPVFLATVLISYHLIERNGTQLATRQGTLVAAGYPDTTGTLPLPWDGTSGTPLDYPTDDELVAYVTGQVTIRRGPVDTKAASTGDQRVHNERSALAERPYDVAFECMAAAVKVVRDPYTVTP